MIWVFLLPSLNVEVNKKSISLRYDTIINLNLCFDLLPANLVVQITSALVFLEMSGLDTLRIQLVKFVKTDTFGLGIQEPAENGYDKSQREENEADFAAEMSGVWVDLISCQLPAVNGIFISVIPYME